MQVRVELEHSIGNAVLIRLVLGRVFDLRGIVLELLFQDLIGEKGVFLESLRHNQCERLIRPAKITHEFDGEGAVLVLVSGDPDVLEIAQSRLVGLVLDMDEDNVVVHQGNRPEVIDSLDDLPALLVFGGVHLDLLAL